MQRVTTLYGKGAEVELGIHVSEESGKCDVNAVEEELYGEEEPEEKVSRGQLALIYSLQLAEAYVSPFLSARARRDRWADIGFACRVVAASLQPQLYVLLRENELCGSVNSAYWTGLVEAIFALGSIAGLVWGRIGDHRGRRPVALIGMLGLALSCVA